jgi:hypothetical protein
VLGGTATGYAVSKTRITTIRPDTAVVFKGFDFTCYFDRSDPNKIEVGPILDCGRGSTTHAGSNCPGRRVTISRYHIVVANLCNGPPTQMRFNRSP